MNPGWPLIVLVSLLLVGCPAEHRLYIHNNSKELLSSAYLNSDWKRVDVEPGKTGWIWYRFGKASCFSLMVGGAKTAYELPREVLAGTKKTSYGGRIDLIYEHGKIRIRCDREPCRHLVEIAECADI